MLNDVKNIEFNIELAHQSVVNIEGTVYLCEHGNTIKGWAGTPWYGLDRKVGMEARRIMVKSGFDKIIIQHFHTPLNTQYYMVGGSLSGTSEYDHTCGRYSIPCQCAWLLSSKFGEFNWCSFKG